MDLLVVRARRPGAGGGGGGIIAADEADAGGWTTPDHGARVHPGFGSAVGSGGSIATERCASQQQTADKAPRARVKTKDQTSLRLPGRARAELFPLQAQLRLSIVTDDQLRFRADVEEKAT